MNFSILYYMRYCHSIISTYHKQNLHKPVVISLTTEAPPRNMLTYAHNEDISIYTQRG